MSALKSDGIWSVIFNQIKWINFSRFPISLPFTRFMIRSFWTSSKSLKIVSPPHQYLPPGQHLSRSRKIGIRNLYRIKISGWIGRHEWKTSFCRSYDHGNHSHRSLWAEPAAALKSLMWRKISLKVSSISLYKLPWAWVRIMNSLFRRNLTGSAWAPWCLSNKLCL